MISAAQIIQESPDATIVLTEDGTVAHWSRGAQAVFGFSSKEAEGRKMESLIVTEDHLAEHRQRCADVLRRGAATYESIRRRADGSLLYVDVSSRRSQQDGQTFLFLFEKDVTDIKVQRDAKLMEARFRDLLESTPDGIVMANPTGHIVIANSQAEKLFGYEAGELRGRSVDQLLPLRYRGAHVGHRSKFFLQPRKRSMGSGLDLAGLRKDGTEFPVEISLSPLKTEESAFVMSAIRDISERKNFEKALQEKNLELANASQAKDRFLASMSHELRTPLNAIIGFTGTLLMKLPGPLTEEQERQLRTVQTSARHLLALISDLLDLAKIEADKIELRPESVDAVQLAEEVASTLRPQAESKGLALQCHGQDGMHMINVDRRALRQILINLTSNAVKFTTQGYVALEVSQLRDLDGPGRLTRFSVVDTGEGISAAARAKLFGAFSRVSERARDTEGTGLGLHLSQRLASVMGGEIKVESELGQGSCFTLELRSM